MSHVEVCNCAPHPHIGETLTANYLREHLQSRTETHAVVLVNYYLPNLPGTLEIDLVVINSNGVYLLEVKHWAGPIEADQLHWRHASGDLRDNPIPIIEHKARVMHGFLSGRHWGRVSVTGLVVLSKGTGSFHSTDPNAHKVFGLHETLIEALTGRQYVHRAHSPILRDDEVEQLSKIILDSRVTDAERQVAGYRVLDERDSGHYVELDAEDPEFAGRKLRIKQYDVPSVGSQRELDESVSRFKRDMAALVHAGSHPNLVMPHKFHRDESSDERYYLIVDWPGEQTLAEHLASELIDQQEQLRILKGVASALAHCHEHEVYHRNLTPASIFLGSGDPVKVGDFDFARVPTITRTLAKTGLSLVSGRHVSPEQAFHASDVDARADIYSLGAVWYDMLFRPAADEALDRARIDDAPLSEDGREILKSMLSEQRNRRPASMDEVQYWLELLAEE